MQTCPSGLGASGSGAWARQEEAIDLRSWCCGSSAELETEAIKTVTAEQFQWQESKITRM